MTAEEFLTQLERCLYGLTADEKENALSYYREYFEEAGENAAQAAENLGSPQSVAQRILTEIEETDSWDIPDKKKNTVGNILFGVLILICTSPFWATIAVLWLALLFSLAVILLCLEFSAVFAPIQGISYLLNGIAGEGIWGIGSGLLCAGLTMLLWKPFLLLSCQSTKFLGKYCKHALSCLFGKETKS